jgi:hypothetical protein
LYCLTKIDKINSFVFACSHFAEGDGDLLYIYDYRKDSFREIIKGYDSDLLANLDGRYIAYIKDDLEVCVYDTKELKEEKVIKVLKNEEEDIYADGLAVVSKDRIALLANSEFVYIINWKKGMMEYSISSNLKTIGCNATSCWYSIYYLDENLLLLRGYDDYMVLNTMTKSMNPTDVKNEGTLFHYLSNYKKYLYRVSRRVIDVQEYEILNSNKMLALTSQTNEMKINHC